jgi:histidine kinase/DNA gyrase B/HSP90-like ATPase
VPTGSESEHFDIHASVVFQLGESLITDSVQALVELVKNSYDADASYCKLNISTEKVADPESSFADLFMIHPKLLPATQKLPLAASL